MLNQLKKIIFYLYCRYDEQVPIKKGKHRLAQLLEIVFGYAIYNINGVKLELNPMALIDKKMICGKNHDSIVYETICQSLNQGGIFLDIGANIGYFSIKSAKMPKVKVFAFEPSPRELSRFYRNILLNECFNITVFPYGLSETNNSIPFYIVDNFNPGMNSVIQFYPDSKQIMCNFFALDYLISAKFLSEVQMCKIDVEGFEIAVLKGMANSIPMMEKAIFVVEISPVFLGKLGHKTREIYDFFENYGYQPRFGISEDKQYDEVFTKNPV